MTSMKLLVAGHSITLPPFPLPSPLPLILSSPRAGQDKHQRCGSLVLWDKTRKRGLASCLPPPIPLPQASCLWERGRVEPYGGGGKGRGVE